MRNFTAAILVLGCVGVALADQDEENAKAAKAACEKAQTDCGQLRNTVANICGLALGDKGTAYDKYWAKRYKMDSSQRAWCEAILTSADNKYTEGNGLWNQAAQSQLGGQNDQSNADSMFAMGQWTQAYSMYVDAMDYYTNAALDFSAAALKYDDVRVLSANVSAFCDTIP